MVGECRSLFEAKRRELLAAKNRLEAASEETQRALDEERQHQLALAAAQTSLRAALQRHAAGRLVLWTYDRVMANWFSKAAAAVISAIVVTYVVMPLRRAVASLVETILRILP